MEEVMAASAAQAAYMAAAQAGAAPAVQQAAPAETEASSSGTNNELPFEDSSKTKIKRSI
jgi:ribosomal protein L12E/L44/L45/RPP1/RPP2